MLLYGTGVALNPAEAIAEALDHTNAAAHEEGLRIVSISHDVTMLPEQHIERASILAKAFGGRATELVAYASVTAVGVELAGPPAEDAAGQWWS